MLVLGKIELVGTSMIWISVRNWSCQSGRTNVLKYFQIPFLSSIFSWIFLIALFNYIIKIISVLYQNDIIL